MKIRYHSDNFFFLQQNIVKRRLSLASVSSFLTLKKDLLLRLHLDLLSLNLLDQGHIYCHLSFSNELNICPLRCSVSVQHIYCCSIFNYINPFICTVISRLLTGMTLQFMFVKIF